MPRPCGFVVRGTRARCELLEVHERLDRAGVAAAQLRAASRARASPRRRCAASSARAQSGRCAVERAGSAAISAALGRFAASHSRNSRRNASTVVVEARASCAAQPEAARERRAVRDGVAEQRVARLRALQDQKWRSCSHVKPMPPWSWRPSRTSEALAVARRGLRERGGLGAPRVVLGERERGEVAERGRALDREVQSASRCLSAWNEPIGRSYWRRTFAYSSVSSKMRRQVPTVASASATVATSSARATARSTSGRPARRARARPAPPRRRARGRRAASVGSISVRGVGLRGRAPGTRNTPSSPASPRATTAISSAVAPSSTARLAAASASKPSPRAARAAGDRAERPSDRPRRARRVPVSSPRREAPASAPGLARGARVQPPGAAARTASPSRGTARARPRGPAPRPPGRARRRRGRARRAPRRSRGRARRARPSAARARRRVSPARATARGSAGGHAPRARDARCPAARAGRRRAPGPSAPDGS